MSNVALRCTDEACAAHNRVQATPTCAVCGKPTVWTVLRVPPQGTGPIAPIYSTPMPLKGQGQQAAHLRPAGSETRTCTNAACSSFHLVQDAPVCAACGEATVVAKAL
ncbi:hypothetical protein [Cellulomonas xylanilytica]|uniref:Uncharacterized protein n=1 Tax=Cellulomonas xylanilytica TaxID=233583 RepID=A0A510VD75_9CELL|nr:hypothetical protein [Cellulomonas xylanilytica]GEK23170.1 hypothetical protein CXY01_36900 [Cellulomonas xylanilytica]